MPTLTEIRQQFPQYSDLSDQDLADGLYKKFYQDLPREEFEKKIGIQRKPEPTIADTLMDVGSQAVRGFNKGLVGTITAPYRAVDWLIEKATGGSGLPDADQMALYKPFLHQPEAETTAGRYAGAAGEAVGATAIPAGAILGNANRLAALAPTTLPRAVGQTLGESVAARPGAAVAADVISSTGSGLSQQGAQDAGFGPVGQTIASIAGGAAPLAVGSTVARATNAGRGALARSDPYARVARGLGDQSIDDVAESIATGTTRQNADINRRVLDTLGEEMVRANGNRQAAIPATIARLQAETGASAATARDQVRRVANAQADSELFFGEYPAVAQSNADTRLARNLNEDVESRAGRQQDTGTQWEIDNVANAGTGPSAQNVRNAVMGRMEALRDQMRERLGRMSPGQQTLDDADALINNMTQQARADYAAVHSNPGAVNYSLLHRMLPRVVDRHLARMRGRGDDQAQALFEAIDRLYTDIPSNLPGANRVSGYVPGLEDQTAQMRLAIREARRQRMPRDQIQDMERQADAVGEQLRITRRAANPRELTHLQPSLQMLQDMRGGIRGQIEAARRQGRADIANVLQPLYSDITRLMERSSPQWARANRRWADLNIAQNARELGEAFALRPGPQSREQLRQFQQLAPEAQDLVRIEYVQKLLDRVNGAGDTHDLAKLFANPHMRQTVRSVLGPEAAVDLARLIRDNQVATKSRNMLGGSPSQPRLARQKDIDNDLGMLASVEQASMSGFRKWALDWTINVLKERRNRVVGRIVTTPVRDTPAVAEHLERMRRAQARAAQFAQPLNRLLGTTGYVAGSLPALDGSQ